jgi:hypothetical protein
MVTLRDVIDLVFFVRKKGEATTTSKLHGLVQSNTLPDDWGGLTSRVWIELAVHHVVGGPRSRRGETMR